MININFYRRLTILCLIALSTNANANPKNAVEAQLINKITDAKSTLVSVEKNITNQRQALAKKLSKLERKVIALRDKTAVARRLSDEKTLSLSLLEKRLTTWQQQHVFQKNLLHRYLQTQNLPTTDLQNSTNLPEQLLAVLTHSETLSQRFYPHWQQEKVVMPSGEIAQKPTLSIGPITWYWDEISGQAGFASKRDASQSDKPTLQHYVYLNNSNSIAQLRTATVGEIVFDPTLDQVVKREQHAESLIEHVIKGGVWAIPILLFALFALTIAFFKVIQLARLPKFVHFTPSVLQGILQNKNSLNNTSANVTGTKVIDSVQGMQKALLDITTHTALSSKRDDLLFMKLQECRQILDRRISAIAITAAVSPLLGLLGTVSGMIETFKMMTLFGSGDPEVVSGGIAQALVTTELGLVVAIPALILNAVLSRKAKSYYAELENFAILISKQDELPAPISNISELPHENHQSIQGVVA